MRRKPREQEFFKKQNKYAKGGSKKSSALAFVKIQLFSIQRTRIVSGLNYTEAHECRQNPDHHQSRDNGQRWQHSISLIFICPITSCHSYANSIFEDTSFLHPTIRRSEAVRSTRMSSYTTGHHFTQRASCFTSQLMCLTFKFDPAGGKTIWCHSNMHLASCAKTFIKVPGDLTVSLPSLYPC